MAASFPQHFIDSIRNAGDIVRLVSDYVPLKQSGARLKGLCPFHQEKTPSFSVDPNLQLFYCFGCQTGGDVFKFVTLYEKLSFPESVEFLARRWGVALPESANRKGDDAGDRLRALNREAETFFKTRLAHPQVGSRAREYFKKRGFADETSARMGLGYAVDGWEALRGHLLAMRYTSQDLLQGGLVLPRKSGSGEYDRFRDRLIFPIRDVNGRTIGFGGRALGDDEPKYINSPETPAYKKGQHLYGLDLSREGIRREGFAIVVEGYLDLAAVLESGQENVVASLGTAFTAAQARLLARYTNRVVFSYDGDSAGAKATARSLDLLLAQGFEVRVTELPGGSDPDDFIRANGAEAYRTLVREAPEYLDFLIHREVKTRDLGRIDDKVAAVNAVLPHVAGLTDPIRRAAWAGRLADALQIDDELVLQQLRRAIKSATPRIRERAPGPQPIQEAEARLVTRLLASTEELARWKDELDVAELEGSPIRPIVEVILQLARSGSGVDYPTTLNALQDEADRDLLTQVAFREEPEDGPSVEDCLWSFRRKHHVKEERRVRREITRLQEGAAAPSEVDERLQRLQELARERDAQF